MPSGVAMSASTSERTKAAASAMRRSESQPRAIEVKAMPRGQRSAAIRSSEQSLRGGESRRCRYAHFIANVANRDLEQLIERHLGTIAHQPANLVEIGHAAAHVFERA